MGAGAQLLREGLVTPGQQPALASSHAEDFEERLRVHRQAGYQVLCYGDEAYPACCGRSTTRRPCSICRGRPAF